MCGPLPVYWQFAMERTCGTMGEARSKRKPNESLANLFVHQEQMKLVLYCLPAITGGSLGGCAGTGLNNSRSIKGDRFVGPTGRLSLVRLFGFYKSQLDEKFELNGFDQPLDPDAQGIPRRQQLGRRYTQHTLAGLQTLPANYVTQTSLIRAPADFYERAHRLDFEFTNVQANGRPRPSIHHEPSRMSYNTRLFSFYQPINQTSQSNRIQDDELAALFRFFAVQNMVPQCMYGESQSLAERLTALQEAGFNNQKWKVLEILKPYGRVGATKTRLTSKFEIRKDIERDSSVVQLLPVANSLPIRSGETQFGSVRYFLSCKHPEQLPGMTMDNAPPPPKPETLLLVCVDLIPIEETSDGILMRRMRYNNGQNVRGVFLFVPVTTIAELVDIERCYGRDYIIWMEKCWTSRWERTMMALAIESVRRIRGMINVR